MKRLKLLLWTAVLATSIATAPITATAQVDDTLSMSGTFRMKTLTGTVGDDLTQVYANNFDHTWTLTLYGVTYSHSFDSYYWFDEWGEYLNVDHRTHVHATSFDFEFSGPDANVLNNAVSQQLVGGGDDGVFLTLRNNANYSLEFEAFPGGYGTWDLQLSPLDIGEGVSFHTSNWQWMSAFASDEDGYPLVEPQRVRAYHSTILDKRPGNSGILQSDYDYVDIGSTEPPYLPPSLSILDGSAKEGNKGKTNLNLTVTLSASSSTSVTVNYATADGTASKKSDYTAKSGTVTFQPGETSRTIFISVTGDRKREPNETFTVMLSNPVGATIADESATATILNDD